MKSVLSIMFALVLSMSTIPVELLSNEKSTNQEHNFDPSLFYLVDQVDKNFLFRGNMPQENGTFAYEQLTSSIEDTLSKLGINLPSDYQLHDLSLLHDGEEQDIDIEQSWFKNNPGTGSFQLHSLFGTFFNPVDFPAFIRNYFLTNYDIDGLRVLTTEMRNILEQSPPYLVMYVHCELGKDRTGEAVACYLMHYKGYSYTDAINLDDKIANRPVGPHHLNAIRWYAFYLRDFEGISTIGSIEGY